MGQSLQNALDTINELIKLDPHTMFDFLVKRVECDRAIINSKILDLTTNKHGKPRISGIDILNAILDCGEGKRMAIIKGNWGLPLKVVLANVGKTGEESSRDAGGKDSIYDTFRNQPQSEDLG